MRKSFLFFIAIIVQLLVFILVYNSILAYARGHAHQRHDISWGIYLQLAFVFYVVLAFLYAALLMSTNKLLQKLLISVVICIVFFLVTLPVIHDLPYRAAHLLLSGYAGNAGALLVSLFPIKKMG